MSKIMKELKSFIVMLLVCAMVAGSVPVNTYAAELDNDVVATEEVVTEEVVTEVTTEPAVVTESVSDSQALETEDIAVEDGEVIPTEETTLTTTETEELEAQEEVAYVPHKVTVSSNALDLVETGTTTIEVLSSSLTSTAITCAGLSAAAIN